MKKCSTPQTLGIRHVDICSCFSLVLLRFAPGERVSMIAGVLNAEPPVVAWL